MNPTLLKEKISLKEKIGYSFGDLASNLYFQVWVMFLMYFYTDVFGISAAAVGTMFLITRLWDAVNDPVMGMLADRTKTRWGKFRPYLLWCALPFGILGALMFTTPDYGESGKLVYAYITYIAMMMIYTAINVPYAALMGVLSPSAEERTEISSFRFVAVFSAGLIVQASVLMLVKKLGGGNEALGWQLAMSLFSALAVVLFLTTFFTTKERVQPTAEQKSSFALDLKDLSKNRPWLLSGITIAVYLTMLVIRNSTVIYYFKYYVQQTDFTFLGTQYQPSFEAMTTIFLTLGTVFTIFGVVLTKQFTKRLDKHKVYIIFLILLAISSFPFLFFTPEHMQWMLISQMVFGFSMGPIAVVQWAIFTDTADYSEWKNGRRATGLIMSASLFALKMGVALGGTLLGWFMSMYGFVPNEVQSTETLMGIRQIFSVCPAVLCLVCVGTMYFYSLGNEKMITIEKELTARRQAYSNSDKN